MKTIKEIYRSSKDFVLKYQYEIAVGTFFGGAIILQIYCNHRLYNKAFPLKRKAIRVIQKSLRDGKLVIAGKSEIDGKVYFLVSQTAKNLPKIELID